MTFVLFLCVVYAAFSGVREVAISVKALSHLTLMLRYLLPSNDVGPPCGYRLIFFFLKTAREEGEKIQVQLFCRTM